LSKKDESLLWTPSCLKNPSILRMWVISSLNQRRNVFLRLSMASLRSRPTDKKKTSRRDLQGRRQTSMKIPTRKLNLNKNQTRIRRTKRTKNKTRKKLKMMKIRKRIRKIKERPTSMMMTTTINLRNAEEDEVVAAVVALSVMITTVNTIEEKEILSIIQTTTMVLLLEEDVACVVVLIELREEVVDL